MANFDASSLKKIGVYTSGGDAPGMNACLRAVVRLAISRKIEVLGIENGYSGMIDGRTRPLQLRDMANIIQRGGTILKTGRSNEFLKPEFRKKAADQLRMNGIEGLVCIGGDGSFRGAQALWDEHRIPLVGAPGTIDNDIYGTDRTIGFDTALNTALDAIDRIRDTATSHDRLFIVEVMGRNSGFIASCVGLAGGAEDIFTPEGNTTVEKTVERLKEARQRGKLSSIIVMAEGHKPGRAYDLADSIRTKFGVEPKVTVLGHIQRGGTPSAMDRVLASRMGAAAVEALLAGKCNMMIGSLGDSLVEVPFETCLSQQRKPSLELVNLTNVLAN
jgi:6-phosphofructokinase 1